MVRRKLLPLALCLALAGAITPLPRAAHALDEEAQVERFNSTKFWTYAGCAASLVFATGTGGWVLVAIACGRAATAYWTD